MGLGTGALLSSWYFTYAIMVFVQVSTGFKISSCIVFDLARNGLTLPHVWIASTVSPLGRQSSLAASRAATEALSVHAVIAVLQQHGVLYWRTFNLDLLWLQSILIAAICSNNIFQNSNPAIIFVLFFLFGLATMSLCMLVRLYSLPLKFYLPSLT